MHDNYEIIMFFHATDLSPTALGMRSNRDNMNFRFASLKVLNT